MVGRVLRQARLAFRLFRRAGPLKLSFGPTGEPASHLEKSSWELRKDAIGVYSIQGRRPHMEDRFNVVDLEQINASIYGVFDGHGGEFAVDFAEKTLSKALMGRLLSSASSEPAAGDAETTERASLPSILHEEILQVDKQLVNMQAAAEELSGTTALVAVLRGSELVVANVGDSRGVLCDVDGKVIPMSHDHKPHEEKERTRIMNAGGFVIFNGVWRVVGVLAMSRALGDYPLKENDIVIATPDILTFDLNSIRPRFIILATDGLWDVFDNEEACSFVRGRLDEPHCGARSLALAAYQRGSLDNITVMVVNLERRIAARSTMSRRESFA